MPRYAEVALPFTSCQKSGTEFAWSAEAGSAFENLKEKPVNAPILAVFDCNRKTEPHTDASAGMLLQKDDNATKEKKTRTLSERRNGAHMPESKVQRGADGCIERRSKE